MKKYSILILVHLCWLSLFMSTFGVWKEIVCIPNERETLLKFKHHLKDPSNRLSSWNATVDSNCCHWVGVLCNNITAHVAELRLNISEPSFYHEDVFDPKTYKDYFRSVFSGEINPCLVDLKYLNYLDFSGNYFVGMPIPSFIATMASLTHLNLSNAGFDGNIPPQIGNLSNLLYLDLGRNGLFAENIDWVSSLSKLRYLDLSGMFLRTQGMSLPTHLGKMTSLTHLDLSDAAFSGNIPSYIGNLSNLVYLDFESYSMFPQNLHWLSSLSKLEYLGLGGINLSQSFHWLNTIQDLPSLMHFRLLMCAFPHNNPPSLFNFKSSLLILNIFYSKISFVPEWVFGLKTLVSLTLRFNNFEGPIPSSIGNLTLLENLDLAYNSFSSSIPNALYSLHHLKILNLESNNLHGTISNAVGNLTSLVRLDLEGNSISGTLPISFGKLSSLISLDLTNNQFNGNPFESIGSLSKLVNLQIPNNCFKGVVTEDNLENLTMLLQIIASRNNLTLKVGFEWYPTFQLTILNLNSWNLGPNFPSWIQSQNTLQDLRMSNTGILDTIPTWFWDHFSQASYLDLSHNQIHGELGATLKNPISVYIVDLSTNHFHGKLPHLSNDVVNLDLSSNSFSGSMDDFLCRNLDKSMALQFLNLASNNLSGDLPNCWNIWPFLVEVSLQNNYFVGNLPPSMGSLAVLQSFQIRKNILSGVFPTSLKKNNQLIILDLGENNLSGTIPPWVGEKLLNVKILCLRSNNFSGHIPICDMGLLQVIDLAENHLFGNIPTCFNKLGVMTLRNRSTNNVIYSESPYTTYYTLRYSMVSMLLWLKGTGIEYGNILGLVTSIDLSRNKLSREIPREITDLDGLIYLNLSKNQLSGQIPPSIGNMRLLESIDISKNQISGEIPLTISNLSFLNHLDLSYNHLEGKIPTNTQIQSFEASDFVENNLCGPPLLINCNSNQQSPYIDRSEIENGEHGVNWFFVSMALGFVVGFWLIVAPLFIYKSWRYAYFCFLDDMWYKLQSCW